MVVLTTVGYGDLGPTTPAGKIVTCFFVLYAMVMAAQALGILTAAAVAKAEKVAALAAVEHRNNARRERADSRAQLAVARRRARDAKRARALASIALIVAFFYICAGTLIVGSALGTFVDTYLDSVQEA